MSLIISSEERRRSVGSNLILDSSVRHGSGLVYAADQWADYWLFDGANDFLSAAGDSVLSLDSNKDISIIVGFENNDAGSTENTIFYQGDDGSNFCFKGSTPYDNAKILIYSNGTNTGKSSTVYNKALDSQKSIALMKCNTVDSSHADIACYCKDSAGASSDVDANQAVVTTQQASAGFYVAAMADGSLKFEGKIYFIAIFHSDSISDSDLADVWDGTVNPVDLTPVFYIDFSKAVGSTYKSEVGEITLSVAGSPTKNP